jgi:hypothetical protein
MRFDFIRVSSIEYNSFSVENTRILAAACSVWRTGYSLRGMQLSLLERARLEIPTASDAERVSILAQRLIAELDARPPIDLEMVASWQGVDKIDVADIPWAGCLINDGGRILMQLRRGDSRRRPRFTGFHEIGHTFCPGFRLEAQFRCNPPIPTQSPIEVLCDVAAAELLYPRRLVESDLAAADFGIETVIAVADDYDGSLESAGHRFVSLWPDDTLMLVLEPGIRRQEEGTDAEPKLRVRSVHAKGHWPYIPRNKSVEPDHALGRALLGELVDEHGQLDGVCSSGPKVDVSARLIPYVRDGEKVDRVLALYRRPPQ